MHGLNGNMTKYSHGGDIYRNDIVLDFSVNGNPLGPPDTVLSLFSNTERFLTAYPDPDCARLRAAIASRDGLSQDMIICTNGAAEFICCLVKAVSPKKGLILTPAFSEYERCLEANNAECTFTSDEGAFLQAIENVDIAFLCNPVNPTGVLLDRSFMDKALKAAEEGDTWLVIDESFLRFLTDYESMTLRSVLKYNPKLVVVDSFTKIYAIPGLRLGYGMTADRELKGQIKDMLPMWNVSTIAQAAGIKALEAKHYLEEAIAYLNDERQRLSQLLSGMGFKVTAGTADFLFFESSKELYKPLLSSGILIRDCNNYRGIGASAFHYRIAIRKKEENDRLILLIKKLLDQKGSR